MEDFAEVLDRLANIDQPINQPERQEMCLKLTDSYNYVSAQVRGISLTNALYSQSAQQKRKANQLEHEREQLKAQREFVENTFRNADQYLRAIQLGGYAALFALWGFMRQDLSSTVEIWSAILLLTSASAFIFWELFKATALVLSLNRHARLGLLPIEDFIKNRIDILGHRQSLLLRLARLRSLLWFAAVVPGFLAIVLLLVQFALLL